jgi:arylsulfatase A-like enzyme
VNVVLLILDCVRPDHVGCYGDRRGTTPNLDAFAIGATRFDNAITAGVWTLPSMASMMTGLYPSQHRLNRVDRALGSDLVTLPQRLARAGWRTSGFTANPHGGRTFQLDRGFQEFHEFWARLPLDPPAAARRGQAQPGAHRHRQAAGAPPRRVDRRQR